MSEKGIQTGMKSPVSKRWLLIVPWLFVVLWSTGFIGARYGLPYSEPFTFLSWRMAFNILIFILLLMIFRIRLPAELSLWKQQAIAGCLIHGAYLGGVFSAIETGAPAGLTALMVSLQPILTGLVMAVAYGNAPDNRQWAGLIAGISGVALVLTGGQADLLGGGLLSWSEAAWILVALAGITIGTLYQKHYCEPQPVLTASLIQYIASLPLMLFMAFVLGESGTMEWHAELIGALVWSVLILSVGAVLLLMKMIQMGEATRTASYFYLVPPFTALEAWWLFDERLTPVALIGMSLTVFGVYWVNKTRAS